ncbi:MAG: hypothetical protein DRJ32_05560 [Thermoprotei archaeon]|nr:MAG: hypothetical protein DRJ32_05560 [Thermoprotei archaeon]
MVDGLHVKGSPLTWHPNVFRINLDAVSFVISIPSLIYLLYRRDYGYPLLYILNLAFLIIWPVKWPQYLCMFILPMHVLSDKLFRKLLEEIVLKLMEEIGRTMLLAKYYGV